MNPPQMKQATAPLPGALPTQRHPLPRTGPRHLPRAPPVRRPRTARPSVWQELPQAQSRAQGLEGPFNFGTSMEFTDCLKEMKAGSRSPGLDHLSPSTLGTGRLHRDLPTAENTFMHGVYDLFSNLLTDLNEREAMKEVNAAYVVLGDAGRLPHQSFQILLVHLAIASHRNEPVSYTHLRAHETKANLVCRLLLEKKKTQNTNNPQHELHHYIQQKHPQPIDSS